jgi:hypothetical protein
MVRSLDEPNFPLFAFSRFDLKLSTYSNGYS